MYNFGLLDPRSNNDALLGDNTLGIEITRSDLAERCGLGNIDPQHTDNNNHLAAIEVAMTVDLPQDGATIVTLRPDLDSVGAMAVLLIRRDAEDAVWDGRGMKFGKLSYYKCTDRIFTLEEKQRIRLIASFDKFAHGKWRPTPLPTKENRWPSSGASAESVGNLAAIAAAVSDFKVDIATRVRWMVDWLLFGREPEGYRDRVEAERSNLISALESGTINYSVVGGIAVVQTTHRAATMIGYSLAPVVVALNPEFRFQGGDVHKKFTICQYQAGYVDLIAVKNELAAIEDGWGGSPTIIGSPQGKSSQLTIDQIVTVVSRHLHLSRHLK